MSTLTRSAATGSSRTDRPLFRILITGSRDFPSEAKVHLVLDFAFGMAVFEGYSVEVVHGACPKGGDLFAKRWVRKMKGMGFSVEEDPCPADWNKYGKSAGHRRNAEMVQGGADICLAFIHNGSEGASRTAALSERYGIETHRYISQGEIQCPRSPVVAAGTK